MSFIDTTNEIQKKEQKVIEKKKKELIINAIFWRFKISLQNR